MELVLGLATNLMPNWHVLRTHELMCAYACCCCWSSQGIYFAAKSGRMCAEAIVEASQNGKKMCGEDAIRVYLDK
jgi:hypothetical protein